MLDVTQMRRDTRPSVFFVQLKRHGPGNKAMRAMSGIIPPSVNPLPYLIGNHGYVCGCPLTSSACHIMGLADIIYHDRALSKGG